MSHADAKTAAIPSSPPIKPPPPDAAFDPTLPTNDLDEYCWTPLQLASRAGDLVEIEALLAAARGPSERAELANAPARGYYGQTALQAACQRGHAGAARALLAAGADIHAPGGANSHRDAFSLACGAAARRRSGCCSTPALASTRR